MFQFGSQFYLRFVIVGMKRETLQQHKEIALICKEGIFVLGAQKTLFEP
jgi:hypothetical protein